jgi:hypothetical protein
LNADDIKREFDRSRLIALARREGLETAPNRIQCPHRCSEDKRGASVGEDGLWFCQRCNRGDSAIGLIMATRNISNRDAIEYLATQVGALPPAAPPKPHTDAKPIWQALATTDDVGIEYLKTRGLDAAVKMGLVRFNVGGLGHKPRCRPPKPSCVLCWLDGKADQGYRVALALYSTNGGLVSFQMRSANPAVAPGQSKYSLAGAPYPDGGTAFGNIGQARTAKRVFVTEGIADTLALLIAGMPTLGAPGVDQLQKLLGFVGDVGGRTIVLCPQNDAPRVATGKKVKLTSEAAFRQLADQLSALGADVRTLTTPAPHKDPADWLKAVGRDAFRAELDAIPLPDGEFETTEDAPSVSGNLALVPVARIGADPRPIIRIRTEEHEVVAEAVQALRKDKTVFQRDGMLVHVVRDESDHESTDEGKAPYIAKLPSPVLRLRLTANARFQKMIQSKNREKKDHPPDWVVRGVDSLGTWKGLRWLSGIVEAPVLRPDGSILDEAGYDRKTKLLFEPTIEFLPVSSRPTAEEVARAVNLLTDAVCDFPFELDAHRSAWIAAVLTPLCRDAFEGPAPLFLFDSNTRGSGKSKLVDLASVIVTGREIARMPAEDREEEWRKRITSVAMEGALMILIDNVVGFLGSKSLDAVLTGTKWKDRILGGHSVTEFKLRAVWYATGNNVQVRNDLSRRALHVRLNTPHERPEERQDFVHADLLGWARAERAKLLHAALTIVRGYIAAGRRDQRLPSFGSYEAWTALVRNSIVWAGLNDPCDTRATLAEAADTDGQAVRLLILAWEELFDDEARSVRDVCTMFEAEDRHARVKGENPKQPPLYDVFAEHAPPQGGAFNRKAIGNLLAKFRGRVVDGRLLDCKKDRNGVGRWRVVRAGSAGSCGVALSPGSEKK